MLFNSQGKVVYVKEGVPGRSLLHLREVKVADDNKRPKGFFSVEERAKIKK